MANQKLITYLVALFSLIIFYSIQNLSRSFSWRPDLVDYILPVTILAFFISVIFSRTKYSDFPTVFVALTRTTAVGILFYLIVEPPDFTITNPERNTLFLFVNWGYWIAFLAAVISIWRPSYLYFVAYYVMGTRYVVEEISGFTMSTLDIVYMMEMAQFLAMSACGITLISALTKQGKVGSLARILRYIDLPLLAVCVAFMAIGFHLGNYFWSGVAKFYLGPQPWSWALENSTHNLILGALKRGVLPSGSLPWVTQLLFDGSRNVIWISNILIVLVQIFAIASVLMVRWLRLAGARNVSRIVSPLG